MKKLFTIVLAAGVLAACSTGSKPEATIEGTVTGIADGTTVYLDSARVKIDSTVVEAGKFRFEMVKAYPNQNALIFEIGRAHV